MKIPKLKKNNWIRVSVEWIDSTKFRRPWWTYGEFKEEIKNVEPDMSSVGYMFHQDKDYIYLASSIMYEESLVTMFGEINSIPQGCIKSLKKI